MSFTLRPLDVHDDLDALTELIHRAYAALGQMGLNFTAVDQTVETTAERCAAGETWLAVDNEDTVVGTVTMSHPDPYDSCPLYRDLSQVVLNQLAVEPSIQRCGIGRALVECVESRGAACGYRSVALDTAENAVDLVAWYRTMGYEIAGVIKWEDKTYRSVLMCKVLT